MRISHRFDRYVDAYHFCGLRRPVPTLCEPAPEAGAKDNGHDNTTATTIADFDSAWKRALNLWLPDCFHLFWPDIFHQIDWTIKPEFLEQELNKLQTSVKRGITCVDKLVRVHFRNGQNALLLIHIEIQAGRGGPSLAQRMLRYHNRLLENHPDHIHCPCAILLDRTRGPNVETLRIPMLGGEHLFRFPVVNLGAWAGRQPELHAIAPNNPFAVVILAQLTSRATRPDQDRLVSKLELAKLLKLWGYTEGQRIDLIRVIDDVLRLPEALEDSFYTALTTIEDPHIMEHLNSFQRVRLRREKAESEEKGRHEGIAQVLHTQLSQKFGTLPGWVDQRIQQADAVVLQRWAISVLTADSLDVVFSD